MLTVITLIMGVIGILLFMFIACSFKRLLLDNESGFLHLLMSLMFICWLPIPFAIYIKMKEYDFLMIGTIFGVLSLLLFIFTMLLQAGHLSYSAKVQGTDKILWENRDEWMLNGLLGGLVELTAGFLKGIWAIFLTICFKLNEQTIFFMIGIVYCILTLFYLNMLFNSSINKKPKFLKYLKLNTVVMNLENVVWFAVLLIWLVK